jgi:hypothetical protein
MIARLGLASSRRMRVSDSGRRGMEGCTGPPKLRLGRGKCVNRAVEAIDQRLRAYLS